MGFENSDHFELRNLIERWAIWRDAGYWEKFRSVWHDDGWMMATWVQCSCDDFIEANKAGWAKGIRILHFLGGTDIRISGDRAITETKMTISQRGLVKDVECDALCTGRFFDFWEKREGKWGMVLRQPIYEKDRIDVVEPGAQLVFNDEDKAILAQFPMGYQYLATIQTQAGYEVKRDMPGIDGEIVEKLYKTGEEWLNQGPIDITNNWRTYGDRS